MGVTMTQLVDTNVEQIKSESESGVYWYPTAIVMSFQQVPLKY